MSRGIVIAIAAVAGLTVLVLICRIKVRKAAELFDRLIEPTDDPDATADHRTLREVGDGPTPNQRPTLDSRDDDRHAS